MAKRVETRVEMMGRIASATARKFGRRYFWADLRDLEQQAWDGVLRAASLHDPSKGPLERWLGVSTSQHLWMYIVQAVDSGSPVSIPRGKSVKEAALRGFAEVRGGPVDANARAEAPTPETQLEAAQLHHMVERVIREAIRRHDETGLAREVLIGGKQPAEVAKERGAPVRLVYAATSRTRAALRADPEVLRLRRIA